MNSFTKSSLSILFQTFAGSFFPILLVTSSSAIVDSNDNDMSDLWEKQYNSAQLFPPSFLPADDADGDAVSNQDESIAGTDPADGKPPEGFLQAQVIHSPAVYVTGTNGPEILSPEAFTISWATVWGKSYTLLHSPDLSEGSWVSIGNPIIGYGYDTGTAIAPSQVGGGIPNKLFWRVAVTDIDTDGDGFNDYEEHQKGTNAYVADHDDDGLPDDWEILHGLSPNDDGETDPDNGPNGDPDGDDLINLLEHIYSGDPRDFDTDDDGLDDFYEFSVSFTYLDNPDSDGDSLTDADEFNLHHTNPRNSDSDNDGLSDSQEIMIHLTNPVNPDTDGDGMQDGWELSYQLNPLSPADGTLDSDGDLLSNSKEALLKLNPRLTDTDLDSTPDGDEDFDGDLLTNLEEISIHLTDPTLFDTDGDQMPDGFEANSTHLDPLVYEASTNDPDQDGMSDLYEAIYGFNPDLNDSSGDPDGDGLTTAQERVFGSDPTDDDIDRDGLNDFQEQQNQTDPWNWDTDSDTLPDKWELDHALSPTTPNSGNTDDDGDGLSLYLEYRNGTDPSLDDSDGDGTSDGDEVAANTSPNDPDWGGTAPAFAFSSGGMAANSTPAPPQPETYQAAFDIRTEGKKPSRSCAICHHLQVEIEGKLYSANEPATLLKGKAYDIRVKNTPVNQVPANPEPPHSDTAKFTIWPVAVGDQTITEFPVGSKEPDVFLAKETDVLKYIIGNDEKLLVQEKDWPGNKADEPTNKKASITSVDIINSDLLPTTELKIAKMIETGVLNQNRTIIPANDRDHFSIRIKGGSSMGQISVKVSTTDNPDSIYNDDPTQINLHADGDDSISDELLLVSDDEDDDQPIDNIADDEINDRSHKIQLGGKFKIDSIKIGNNPWQPAGIKAPVHVVKSIQINAVILRNKTLATGGVPLVPYATVAEYMRITKERYAQVGVKIEVSSIGIQDPPAGVDLTDGLTIQQTPTENTIANEARNLITGVGTVGAEDIHIFYVNDIEYEVGLSPAGKAFADFDLAESEDNYTYNAFISTAKTQASIQFGGLATAHELGHLLRDAGHEDSTGILPTIQLMIGGALEVDGILSSKRLKSADETTIQGNSHAQ